MAAPLVWVGRMIETIGNLRRRKGNAAPAVLIEANQALDDSG
jgi:hypothetical protein